MPARSIRIWLWCALLIVLFDQASKWIALNHLQYGEPRYFLPFFNWVLIYNPGASFGLFADAGGWQRWFFTALALGVSVWITLELHKASEEFYYSLALTLVLGGALGNAIDRLRYGVVVDFIQLHVAGYAWPVFNVADSAITLGAILLISDQLFRKKRA